MAPKTSWTGNLKLSLISVPVRLYRAVSATSRISLNMLHEGCNRRIHYRYDCPVHGTVDKNDIVKGYQYEKGKYVVLDEETLGNVKLETTKTMEIVQFVREEELDPVYLGTPYYLAPDGPVAEEAFSVLREAFRLSGKVGIGRVTMAGREHIAAIQPRDKGFVLTTLHYAKEVRNAGIYFEGIHGREIARDELDLAQQLIEKKTRTFHPEEFRDRYDEALSEVIQAKLAGKEPTVVAEEQPGKVVDFMEALKRSIAQEGETRPREKSPSPPRGKRRAPTEKKKQSGKG